MLTAPLVINCCHCRWCQRETGSSYAVNAVIEADRVSVLVGKPREVLTPSESGYGQRVVRCPNCWVALWSHYAGSGLATKVVRVGTLDHPERFLPQAHVFVSSKQPWVRIPEGVPQFSEFYDLDDVWSAESLERRRAILPQIEAWRSSERRSNEVLRPVAVLDSNPRNRPGADVGRP
jgi:hypothetical protein